MQFTLLPSELEQNLSFSGADCDVRHSIVSGFLPLIGSVAQCNHAIHAPTLGTRTKSLFLGRKIHRYGTLPFRKFPIWILAGRDEKSQGVVVRGSEVVGQAERVPYCPPQAESTVISVLFDCAPCEKGLERVEQPTPIKFRFAPAFRSALYFVLRRVLVWRSESTPLVYDKHTPRCHVFKKRIILTKHNDLLFVVIYFAILYFLIR